MSYTMPGQGGVGGPVAYYFYLNGIFEGVVSPENVGDFEGNWSQQGITNLAAGTGQSVSSSSHTTGSAVTPGVKPTDGSTSDGTAVQAGPSPQTDSEASGNPTPQAPLSSGSAGTPGAGSTAGAGSGTAAGAGGAHPTGQPATGGTFVDMNL